MRAVEYNPQRFLPLAHSPGPEGWWCDQIDLVDSALRLITMTIRRTEKDAKRFEGGEVRIMCVN